MSNKDVIELFRLYLKSYCLSDMVYLQGRLDKVDNKPNGQYINDEKLANKFFDRISDIYDEKELENIAKEIHMILKEQN